MRRLMRFVGLVVVLITTSLLILLPSYRVTGQAADSTAVISGKSVF
ncbi:MAG: hypothetical protein M9928_22890 [Anaerolineae bacterium]|nr:hypothetical protein [Anaerolineae bacterium]